MKVDCTTRAQDFHPRECNTCHTFAKVVTSPVVVYQN